jgi:cytochrome c553
MTNENTLHAALGLSASRFAAAAALAVFGFAAPAMAGDIAKGKEKADQVCAACHGKDGNTPIDPSYPKLGGQFSDYLETALIDYQVGRRTNAIMAGQAKALSRDDIRNLAAYYASLPSQLSVRR